MAQILFRDAFQGIFLTIAADFFPGCLSLAECIASGNSTFQGEDTDAEDLAAILFTSGSTGPAKGVAYTHAMFATQLKWLREVYGLNENGRDFPVFPLFGLFSLALGMTIVVPDMNPSRPAKANPRLMMDSLEHYAATMSFASPAFWKTLTGYALPRSLRLTHLKRVFMAGAPVSGTLIESVYRMLPADAEIHIPYGATESLPLSTLEGRTVLQETWPQTAAGAGTCVGKPLAGVRVKVLRILERPLREWDASLEMPTGAIGEIVVASPVTSKHYVVADEDADLYSKIPDGSVTWHRMGDTGYLDSLGRLWFTGRVKHRVILRETTLYPAVVEGIFNARPEVSRSALVGAKGRPVLIVDLNPGFKPRSARGALLEFAADHDQTRGLRDILFLSRLPVDVRHNVKIDREALAIWAAGRLS